MTKDDLLLFFVKCKVTEYLWFLICLFQLWKIVILGYRQSNSQIKRIIGRLIDNKNNGELQP